MVAAHDAPLLERPAAPAAPGRLPPCANPVTCANPVSYPLHTAATYDIKMEARLTLPATSHLHMTRGFLLCQAKP